MSRSKSLGVFVTSHFFSLPLIVLLVALSPIAKAQSTAVLRGSVIDPSGAAVAHAKVVVGTDPKKICPLCVTPSSYR
jgi:hypothetical protein